MKKILEKFTLVDYVVVILVISVLIFGVMHEMTFNPSNIQETVFDKHTFDEISDIYFPYYEEGYIVNVGVTGINASNGDEVNIDGTLVWMEDNGGTNVKLLVESGGQRYLMGLYKNVPKADVYINTISLEVAGTYDNLVEFTLKPENISSMDDLVSKIPKSTNYEISTDVMSSNMLHPNKIQNLTYLLEHADDKRPSIKISYPGGNYKLQLLKSTPENINDANSILGQFTGYTDTIVLRVYNCTDYQFDAIKNNYNVENIRYF